MRSSGSGRANWLPEGFGQPVPVVGAGMELIRYIQGPDAVCAARVLAVSGPNSGGSAFKYWQRRSPGLKERPLQAKRLARLAASALAVPRELLKGIIRSPTNQARPCMLEPLCSSVQECYHRAAEAHNRAAMTSDPEHERFLLEMERRWLNIALSIQTAGRIESFVQSRRA
jgi:hypothetical protein